MDERCTEGLQAGWACLELPVGKEATLFGYEHRWEEGEQGNDGVEDPLFLRCLVLRLGEALVIHLAYDLCLIPDGLSDALVRRVQENQGLPEASIWIHATHTHSTPLAAQVEDHPIWTYPKGGLGSFEADLAEFLLGSVEGVLESALQDLHPCEEHWVEGPCGVGYNRRVKVGEDLVNCWKPEENPDLPLQGPSDPTLRVLHLKRREQPDICWWSLPVHPVVMGKNFRKVSADYPGWVNRGLGEAGIHAFFTLGAAAEIQPWVATQEDPEGLEVVGQAVLSTLRCLLRGSRPCSSKKLETQIIHGAGGFPVRLQSHGSWVVVGLPVEVFNAWGLELRRALGKPLLLSTLCGGWRTYLVPKSAFEEGGYEVDHSKHSGFKSGDAEGLARAILEALEP